MRSEKSQGVYVAYETRGFDSHDMVGPFPMEAIAADPRLAESLGYCPHCGYPLRPRTVNPCCCAERARYERANLAMKGGDA